MAKFGTIYTHKPNPRTTAILAVAKTYAIELDIIYVSEDDKESYEQLLNYNPLGRVPTFVGEDGYVLTECTAITLYITQQCETTSLLGSSRRDYYDILKWMSFCNSDFIPAIGGCILPLIGRRQIIQQDPQDSLRVLHSCCKLIDNHLSNSRYLVGNSITIADYFCVSLLFGLFLVFHAMIPERYPSLARWFDEVYNVPMYKQNAPELRKSNKPYPRLPDECGQIEGEAV